jgi:hypothetical protein
LKTLPKKYSGSGGIRAGEGDAAAQAAAGDDADAENISELANAALCARSYRDGIAR